MANDSRGYLWWRGIFRKRYVVSQSPADSLFFKGSLGLVVTARNYLEVYIYDKWNGKEIAHYEEGEEFMPSVLKVDDGKTSKPSLLTEADLVTLMDKNGIGEFFPPPA
jgi:DNA topoisomerase IA